MAYPIRENWFVAQANGIRYPKADHTGSTTHAGGMLSGATHVRITGMQIITDTNAAAAPSPIVVLVTDNAGVTVHTWTIAKGAATPREMHLALPIAGGFGINTQSADVGVLAAFEVWD